MQGISEIVFHGDHLAVELGYKFALLELLPIQLARGANLIADLLI